LEKEGNERRIRNLRTVKEGYIKITKKGFKIFARRGRNVWTRKGKDVEQDEQGKEK